MLRKEVVLQISEEEIKEVEKELIKRNRYRNSGFWDSKTDRVLERIIEKLNRGYYG